MKKRWIILSILAVLITSLYGMYKIVQHCSYYSVYYAQHMTEKPDLDIVTKVLIWNLNYIERIDEGYRYDFDGTNYVEVYDGDIRKGFSFYSEGFAYYRGEDISWWFDHDMNATHLFLRDPDGDREILEENQIDSKQAKQAKQEIYELIQPIVDIQPEPEVKFQWLFNIYYKRLDAWYRN